MMPLVFANVGEGTSIKKINVKDDVQKFLSSLGFVEPGMTVKVKKLVGEGPVKRRIMDMGITKGTDIYIRKIAPLGDPIELTVRGYELSIRKFDAEKILVE